MLKKNIFDVGTDELKAYFQGLGEHAFRADQVLTWIFKHRVDDFQRMSNLPLPVRRRLEADFTFGHLKLLSRQQSGKDYTTKFLLGLTDGDGIEAVFMRDRDRVTYCISSQAGCPLACSFCATGYSGYSRNLTAGEILEQVQVLARTLDPPHNVVYMGMGEPLLNLGQVAESLQRLTDPTGFGLSPRRITVSTAGIVPGIHRLAEAKRPVNLALSLHAPNNDLRQELMPINRQYPLELVIPALKHYLRVTSRIITLEYIMIADCNMESEHAEQLARIARDTAAKVNLLTYNPVQESGLVAADAARENVFRDRLRALGISATIRYRRGRDIQAACGQLRGTVLHNKDGAQE